MPTVLRLGAWRAVVYANDHRPAHVHVIGQGCEAVFDLHCPDGPAELRENYRFGLREISRIEKALTANLAALCSAWEKIHGVAWCLEEGQCQGGPSARERPIRGGRPL
jgi:hypothetical protein